MLPDRLHERFGRDLDAAIAHEVPGSEVLATAYSEVYGRTGFVVNSLTSQATVLRFRDTANGNGANVFVTSGGKLASLTRRAICSLLSIIVRVKVKPWASIDFTA